MDGTTAGSGPGPRTLIPHQKDVILASEDQVAIDAVAAKLMGLDPMEIKYIRLAHEKGLGVGNPSEIEIVGDTEVAQENWHFQGAFKEMTFASKMQHKIYWGPLKKPIEWSLKTVLAPWSYLASVTYHDMYWFTFKGRKIMQESLQSAWGRLFSNWEKLTPTEDGFDDVGDGSKPYNRAGWRSFLKSFQFLWMAVKEAPEVASHRRHRHHQIEHTNDSLHD
jgi:hypothetical protein